LFVYFAQPIGGGLIKIGSTARLKGRLAQLQIGSPVEITLLAAARGTRRHERGLHEHFSEHRVHGEWFEPCPALIRFIESLPKWHLDIDESKLPRFVFDKHSVFNCLYLAGYGQTEIAEHFGFSRQRADQLITVRRRPKWTGSHLDKPSTFRPNRKPVPELPIADFIATLEEPASDPLAVVYDA
jgi:hypothetical protein